MRRQPSRIEFSMFPFLSVLCCVIGVFMLLLIFATGTRVIVAEPPPPPQPKKQGEAKVQDADIDAETFQKLALQIAALGQTLAELRAERERLERQYEDLVDQLDLKKLELAQQQRNARKGRPIGRPIRVIMEEPPQQGRARGKKPTYLEVTADSFVARPSGETFDAEQLDRAGSPLTDWLKQYYRNRSRQYLVLLIHPEGIGTYHKLIGYFRNAGWLEVLVSRVDIGGGIIRQIQILRFNLDIAVEPFSPEWVWHRSEQTQ